MLLGIAFALFLIATLAYRLPGGECSECPHCTRLKREEKERQEKLQREFEERVGYIVCNDPKHRNLPK